VGLSILIPVYNYNVTSLVQTLAVQLTKTAKEGEIILLDDGSTSFVSENQLLQTIPFVSFHRNEKNEGRMVARQRLSELAQYDHFLFIDCDSDIIKDDFVSAYFNLIEKDAALVTGGRVYTTSPPTDCKMMLHWKYGTKRESSKNAGFMSNNFLIKRELFNQLQSPVHLTSYGHEDSWWGIQFEQLGVQCKYINNPVLHAALEKADIFLLKSEAALANLLILEKNIDKRLLSKHIKIYRWYLRLSKAGLAGLYLFFEQPFHTYFRKNILSCKPGLLFFDCYRLAHLIRLVKKESTV
jgi:glycosyltransferase involved in cell wall biosynthesis